MKRILSSIALCVAFFCAAPASAQLFKWGFVGGLNLSKLKVSGNYKESVKASTGNKCGWYIGPKVMVNLPVGIGIDAALEYSQRDLEINDESEKYRTLEIPVNIRYNIGLGSKAGIYVATGPQFGFALDNMKWENALNGGNFSRNNLNTTWNIGAGVRLLGKLEIGIGYNFALGDTGKAIFSGLGGPTGNSQDYELKYKTNTFQAQVAYFF